MIYKVKKREESLEIFKTWLSARAAEATDDNVRDALQDVGVAFTRALGGIIGVSCACGENADDVTEVIIASDITETMSVPACIICLTTLKGAEMIRSRLIDVAINVNKDDRNQPNSVQDASVQTSA